MKFSQKILILLFSITIIFSLQGCFGDKNTNDNFETQEETVWIPRTGSKYHNDPDCSNMKNPTPVTIEEAEEQGYEPCKKCY